jgi:hypothetical protein
MKRFLTQLAAALVVAAVLASAAHASCIRSTPAQQRARADVIFNGIALENPTPTGIQRFRVSRYLKGRGPLIVRVSTGNMRRADGTGSVTSVSIVVHRGERWQIFAQGSTRRVLRTSVCDGSRRL